MKRKTSTCQVLRICLSTLIFCVSILLTYYSSSKAQTYVNKEWETTNGLPDSVDWSQSKADGQGNIIMTGNTIEPGEKANVLTTKIRMEDGQVLWQKQYDYQQANDYGVDIAFDQNQNILVTAPLQMQVIPVMTLHC